MIAADRLMRRCNLQITLAKPVRTVGRTVLGPREVRGRYVRIVAQADGSGRIEIYDSGSASWSDAVEECTFSDVWSAPALTMSLAMAGIAISR